MPNVNILKLNDILREKNKDVPARGKIKKIQISDKIVEKLKNKNISTSTIEKLSRMQGTIVSDRREVHRKIDGYDFYITDYRGKRGHYETVKVSYRTEKLLAHQNEIIEAEKTAKKTAVISKNNKNSVKKPAVLKTVVPKVESTDFKKTIINTKAVKTAKKINRDKLLNEDLKVIDFKKLEQDNKSELLGKTDQVKKTTAPRKIKNPSSSGSKIIKSSSTVKSNKTSTVSKNTNQSNFKNNNIATKQNTKKSSSNSKKPNSIENNSITQHWFTSSQTAHKSSFWDKIVHVTKTILNCFNITRLVKRGW